MKPEELSKYIKKIGELEYNFQTGDRLLVKLDGNCYISKAEVEFNKLGIEDFSEVLNEHMTEAAILMSLKSEEALMLSAPKYCMECIKTKTQITAVLDDFAQIVGHRAPIFKKDTNRIVSSLKRDSAVLVDEPALLPGYAITVGRNPYEAVVAMTILEKSAEIVLKASAIGGAKELGFFIVNSNRRNYLNKYSKAKRKGTDEEK